MSEASLSRPLVFISWSGARALRIARALAEHIEDLLNVETFISPNIPKGEEWNNAVHSAIRDCAAGVIIVTPENKEAPWLLYEAGAIKTAQAGTGRTKTLFVGWQPADYTGPLEAFQGTQTEREDFYQLLKDLNTSCGNVTTQDALSRRFERVWPTVEAVFRRAEAMESPAYISVDKVNSDLISNLIDEMRSIREDIGNITIKPAVHEISQAATLAAATEAKTDDLIRKSIIYAKLFDVVYRNKMIFPYTVKELTKYDIRGLSYWSEIYDGKREKFSIYRHRSTKSSYGYRDFTK
ncbi:MAG: toll/interleukin-1 receptor domain-containing protein [Bacteroidota bacterium]